MSGAPPAVDGLAEYLAALRAEVEAAGVLVPGSPRAPRPAVLGDTGSEPDAPVIGGARPLVAVATTGGPEAETMRQAMVASALGADLVEVRADLVDPESGADAQGLAASWASPALATASLLAAEGQHTPVLLTVRTAAEGGGADVDADRYRQTLLETIRFLGEARSTGRFALVRAVDVEIAHGCLDELADAAHEAGLLVVASAHVFTTTPGQQEMEDLLDRMQRQGADVAKLAVMSREAPDAHEDVIALLGATARSRAELEIPVITIAMGEQGAPTRLLGGVFGSALTFATAGSGASAPGQLDISTVRQALALVAGQSDGG